MKTFVPLSILAKEEKVLIGATVDLLRIISDLKLTEREIALLSAVVLFHPGKHSHTVSSFLPNTKLFTLIAVEIL